MEQYDLPANETTDSKRSIRYVLYFGLTIILIIFIYFLFNSVKVKTAEVEEPTPGLNNAYFVPPSSDSFQRTVFGTIVSSEVISHENSVISHRLLNENNDVKAYLYSDTNNLDLSIGFNVEVVGIVESNPYNGVEIIQVESIKLK